MRNVYLAQMSLEVEGSNIYYFPYSAGVVWSYASLDNQIADNYQLKEILFRKEPIEDIIGRLEDPYLFGLSSYVWNTNYNEALAKAIKERFPNCKVIIGGANTPNREDDYFIRHPYVDVLVHQEGEISFHGLLKHYLGEGDLQNVPGISYNNNGKRVLTMPSQRIKDLSDIPSPYLIGLFDNILEYAKENNIILNGIIETNRGCPFMCTFCDWGGVTFSKVKKFDITRVQDEILWFAKNEIEYLNDTDANYGIFKDRDMAIIDFLIETKQKYGYPIIFDAAWNKNNNGVTVNMAKKLMDAGLLRRFTASLQSLNPDVLEAIKRTNLNGDQLDNILEEARQRGLSITTETILGLPMETYQSWIDGIAWLLENNFIVESFPLSLLSNSEMNDPDYKVQYGIQTSRQKTHFSKYVDEFQDTVIGTNTMPVADLQRAILWTWFTNLLHANGFTHIISVYMSKKHNIKLVDFYEILLTKFIENKSCVFNKFLQRWMKHAELLEFQYFLAGFAYKEVLLDIGLENRNQFFADILAVVQDIVDDPLLSEVIDLQNKGQRQIQAKSHIVTYSANIYEYITKDAELQNVVTTYNINSPALDDRFNGDWNAFMTFSRKNRSWANIIERAEYAYAS